MHPKIGLSSAAAEADLFFVQMQIPEEFQASVKRYGYMQSHCYADGRSTRFRD
jgi:hypothetical protein